MAKTYKIAVIPGDGTEYGDRRGLQGVGRGGSAVRL